MPQTKLLCMFPFDTVGESKGLLRSIKRKSGPYKVSLNVVKSHIGPLSTEM